jgi:hypothetical protein
MKYIIGDGMTTSLWFDNWHPDSPLADSYGERFIYDSGMEKNVKVNVMIHNLEWKIPTSQAIPSNSNPKMGQKDEIIWLDSPNHRFSVKIAWEQLRIHRQMVEWHDIVWFKNVVPRHLFLLWMVVHKRNFSRKMSFAATVYHVWQEWNARIFAGMSRTSNLVFNQIECIIRDKLDLMRNVLPTNENKRIQRAWRVNNMDS